MENTNTYKKEFDEQKESTSRIWNHYGVQLEERPMYGNDQLWDYD